MEFYHCFHKYAIEISFVDYLNPYLLVICVIDQHKFAFHLELLFKYHFKANAEAEPLLISTSNEYIEYVNVASVCYAMCKCAAHGTFDLYHYSSLKR